jgi:hypothetical protein
VLSLGEQTPKSRWSKVNLGVFPLAPRALTYQFPECRNSDVTRARHLDSTMPPGSHSAPSPSGLRGSRNPRLQVLCCWKPRMPNPRCSGFVPPVPPGIDGPDQIGGSHFASLTCMRPLHSPPRFADVRWKWVLCARRLKPLASPSAINGTLEFGVLLDQLQSPILFLERILRSSPSYCAIETKAIPPELFIYSNSFRVSRPRFLVLGLQPFQEG